MGSLCLPGLSQTSFPHGESPALQEGSGDITVSHSSEAGLASQAPLLDRMVWFFSSFVTTCFFTHLVRAVESSEADSQASEPEGIHSLSLHPVEISPSDESTCTTQ